MFLHSRTRTRTRHLLTQYQTLIHTLHHLAARPNRKQYSLNTNCSFCTANESNEISRAFTGGAGGLRFMFSTKSAFSLLLFTSWHAQVSHKTQKMHSTLKMWANVKGELIYWYSSAWLQLYSFSFSLSLTLFPSFSPLNQTKDTEFFFPCEIFVLVLEESKSILWQQMRVVKTDVGYGWRPDKVTLWSQVLFCLSACVGFPSWRAWTCLTTDWVFSPNVCVRFPPWLNSTCPVITWRTFLLR